MAITGLGISRHLRYPPLFSGVPCFWSGCQCSPILGALLSSQWQPAVKHSAAGALPGLERHSWLWCNPWSVELRHWSSIRYGSIWKYLEVSGSIWWHCARLFNNGLTEPAWYPSRRLSGTSIWFIHASQWWPRLGCFRQARSHGCKGLVDPESYWTKQVQNMVPGPTSPLLLRSDTYQRTMTLAVDSKSMNQRKLCLTATVCSHKSLQLTSHTRYVKRFQPESSDRRSYAAGSISSLALRAMLPL